MSLSILPKGLVFAALFPFCLSCLNAETVIDFEDVSLPAEQFQYGVSADGLEIESTAPWLPVYAVSAKRNLTDAFVYWTNGDDTAVAEGGAGGSDQWFAAYNYAPGDIVFTAPEGTTIRSMEINNLALVDFTIRHGLYQARAFEPGDFLRVRFLGFDQDLEPTGTATDWIDLASYDQELYVLSSWTQVDLSSLQSNRVGFEIEGSDNDPLWGLNTPALLAVDNVVIAPPSEIVQSFVLHAAWSGPGGSLEDQLDTETQLLKEDTQPQSASLANLINSAHGINAVAFDVQCLPAAAELTAADFQFQMSPQGAFDLSDNPPSAWSPAPTPDSLSVIPGQPDRIVIYWPNNTIQNRWLRITVLATFNTGLSEDQVYYLGHLTGETTGLDDGVYSVTFGDISPIRAQVGQSAAAGSKFDINKDGLVTFSDISAMRSNVGAQLTNITVP